MKDAYGRLIHYLRISVTDRCNLACAYCMPAGPSFTQDEECMTPSEIEKIVRVAVQLGVDKVRLTGGEPLMRADIAEIVSRIAAITGVRDLAMTTNGVLLETWSRPLKEAGLHRVNVSLDSIDPTRYRALTGGDVTHVLRGIEVAHRTGLNPIKLNCVIEQSADEPDAIAVAEYAERHGYRVRFIPKMNLSEGQFGHVIGGTGGDCVHCNRLRVTCRGIIKPCLMSDLGYDTRTLGVEAAFLEAISNKPSCGEQAKGHHFYNVGG